MAVITGELGCVDGIHTVKNWMTRSGADHKKYEASNTSRGPARITGNVDWSGRYEALGAQPVKMVRDAFTFGGSVNGAKGVSGACIVDAVEITIGQEAEDIHKTLGVTLPGGADVEHMPRGESEDLPGVLSKANADDTAWGKAANGLQLGVRLARSRYGVDDYFVQYEVVLRNVSNRPLPILRLSDSRVGTTFVAGDGTAVPESPPMSMSRVASSSRTSVAFHWIGTFVPVII